MQIIRDRQALHTIPEPGMELPKTAAYIKNALKDLIDKGIVVVIR